MKGVYLCVGTTYAWVCVKVFSCLFPLTGPWCQLMSVSVSVNVKDAVVIHPHDGGMTLFVTVVMDSASLRGACASAVSERLSLCFTLTHSYTQTHTNALLELTTKACLSNCGGIRLGYKETHMANVSISCSSESLCLHNQEKHGIRFEMLSQKWCP